jgi:CDP-glycerol glycerophosphotransferase (TagB/SpsB family)
VLNAAFIISSHANAYVERPLPIGLYGGRRFRFIFLQHGVIINDLSRWLNPKRINLFVTSTVDEYASITSDGSPYVFTQKDTVLTGLPRHDALLKVAAASAPLARRRILVMPTWRKSLSDLLEAAGPAADTAGILEASTFGANWSALLRSGTVADLIAGGIDVRVLLHPNLSPFSAFLDLPEQVARLEWGAVDIQQELVDCSLLVTDYSSVTFDAALVNTPVIYFQFDQEDFFAGSQPVRRGYFDYVRDGFGPVSSDVAGCERDIADLAARGFRPDDVHAARAEAAFGMRDGNACSRIYREILALDERHRPVLAVE